MTATTHPAWCSLDHGREPAGTHAGVIRLGTDVSGVDISLARLSGEEGTSVVLIPVGFTDSTEEGLGISLDAELTGELARVLAAA